MSQTEVIRQYKATFILDTRDVNEDIDAIVEKLKQEVVKAGGSVDHAEKLGRREFSRVTERGHTGDIYVEIQFTGVPASPADLRTGLKLEKSVKRIFLETLVA